MKDPLNTSLGGTTLGILAQVPTGRRLETLPEGDVYFTRLARGRPSPKEAWLPGPLTETTPGAERRRPWPGGTKGGTPIAELRAEASPCLSGHTTPPDANRPVHASLTSGPCALRVSRLCTQTHHGLAPKPPLGPAHGHLCSQIAASHMLPSQGTMLLSIKLASPSFEMAVVLCHFDHDDVLLTSQPGISRQHPCTRGERFSPPRPSASGQASAPPSLTDFRKSVPRVQVDPPVQPPNKCHLTLCPPDPQILQNLPSLLG